MLFRSETAYSQQELDAMLAPIALFILMYLGFKAALDESRDRFTAPLAEGARR